MSKYVRDGTNKQHLWPSMDVPERIGTCAKLRQGQLLMQRYQWTYHKAKGTKYQEIADTGKEKSIKLAALMVKHARDCNVCCKERVLLESTFYGVWK